MEKKIFNNRGFLHNPYLETEGKKCFVNLINEQPALSNVSLAHLGGCYGRTASGSGQKKSEQQHSFKETNSRR